MIQIIIGLVIIGFSIYTVHEPCLDWNEKRGQLLLWYSSKEKHRNHRKYIILYKTKSKND